MLVMIHRWIEIENSAGQKFFAREAMFCTCLLIRVENAKRVWINHLN